MSARFHLLHAGYIALEASRQRILETADVVVPGHGEPFRTERRR